MVDEAWWSKAFGDEFESASDPAYQAFLGKGMLHPFRIEEEVRDYAALIFFPFFFQKSGLCGGVGGGRNFHPKQR